MKSTRYTDQPNRSVPTAGLRREGTGGPIGSDLGPVLAGYTCSKCGKPVRRIEGSLRMVHRGNKHFHPGCCE